MELIVVIINMIETCSFKKLLLNYHAPGSAFSITIDVHLPCLGVDILLCASYTNYVRRASSLAGTFMSKIDQGVRNKIHP